ncbi:hypothetical protein DSM106972_092080 [Dulcicalothrix desertica PCC 7102]|uniref:ParB/Sulfiredoxin domain-containing protein n=1 Tax=Dulcicalothrix desertica PCC 7102 TaxID=232991 RepID=A0A433UM92_9CYAN|nr:hypothetical protein [Dulcicalothrix desertica]RUS94957.1 hypothetical protein DSM106972_092080 [Dulcicalothrix desertica PCC 7102]TWH62807.1 hypothetical protein CAL7102_00337 [Dulcicalothrix desertica PCC 7102]
MNTTSETNIFYTHPESLVVHPKLIQIYGENESRLDLEQDIANRGVILTPLVVSSRSNVLLSGKCRRAIAIKLGWDSVPVRYVDCASDAEEEAWVLSLNLNRDGKTNYQKMVEAQHWESHLRPLASKNQAAGAEYMRQFLLLSNSTEGESIDLDIKSINVRNTVAKKVKMGAGPYSNSKQVYKEILALQKENKLVAGAALEKELNRSIDAAYKFIRNPNYSEAVFILESGNVGTVGEAIAWANSGERNPFRKYKVWNVYMFTEETRVKDCSLCGRVIDITNEFVVFGFRNMTNWRLKVVHLRPRDIRAELVADSETQRHQRIFSLMEKHHFIEPIASGLSSLLKLPDLTYEEEAFLHNIEFYYQKSLQEVKPTITIEP